MLLKNLYNSQAIIGTLLKLNVAMCNLTDDS
jgi:hypothetical protein